MSILVYASCTSITHIHLEVESILLFYEFQWNTEN